LARVAHRRARALGGRGRQQVAREAGVANAGGAATRSRRQHHGAEPRLALGDAAARAIAADDHDLPAARVAVVGGEDEIDVTALSARAPRGGPEPQVRCENQRAVVVAVRGSLMARKALATRNGTG